MGKPKKLILACWPPAVAADDPKAALAFVTAERLSNTKVGGLDMPRLGGIVAWREREMTFSMFLAAVARGIRTFRVSASDSSTTRDGVNVDFS